MVARGLPPISDFQDPSSSAAQALATLNASLPEGARVGADQMVGAKQKALSKRIDEARFAERFERSGPADRAHLHSECGLGAYGFLQAVPSRRAGTAIGKQEFNCILAERLGVQMLPKDEWCPVCDEVLDSKLRHCSRCVAGGEKTVKHHRARNVVFRKARAAFLSPEMEKGDFLLLPRPGDVDGPDRRPADLYIPTGWNGSPMALDFAITSPTRGDIVGAAAVTPLAAAASYSSYKRTFLDTAEQCERSGVEFVPIVAEATGAWSKAAQAVFHHICAARSRWSAQSEGALFQELVQELSVAIRATNARGILRRMEQASTDSEQLPASGCAQSLGWI